MTTSVAAPLPATAPSGSSVRSPSVLLPPPFSRLAHERLSAIAEMIKAGVPLRVIADEHRISTATIGRAQRTGLLPPCIRPARGGHKRTTFAPALVGRINGMIAEGRSYTDIARAVGVNAKTVFHWARKGIIHAHSPEAIRRIRAEASARAVRSSAHREKMSAALRRYWADPENYKRHAGIARATLERRRVQARVAECEPEVIIVPAWVPPHLSETYLTLAYSKGEEDAAAEVRKLKRGLVAA